MIQKRLFALSFGFAAVLWLIQPAHAEGTCGPRDTVLGGLTARFGETRQAAGLAGPQRLMELYAAPATGTWTVIVTTADGLTCIIAAGDGFDGLPVVAAAGDPV